MCESVTILADVAGISLLFGEFASFLLLSPRACCCCRCCQSAGRALLVRHFLLYGELVFLEQKSDRRLVQRGCVDCYAEENTRGNCFCVEENALMYVNADQVTIVIYLFEAHAEKHGRARSRRERENGIKQTFRQLTSRQHKRRILIKVYLTVRDTLNISRRRYV